MQRIVARVSHTLAGAGLSFLAVACGGGAGADQSEWAARESSPLLCQSEGIHPEGCPITKPTPPVGECPPGDVCTISAANPAMPINGCGPTMYLSQTGSTPSFRFFATCSSAAASAWIASLPAFWTGTTTTTVPTEPVLASSSGQAYVTFAPQGCSADGTSCTIVVDRQGGLLPCTAWEAGPVYGTPPLAGSSWYTVSTCVNTAAVQAVPQRGYNTVGLTNGQSGMPTLPVLPTGYIYLDYVQTPVIGGGCGTTCRTY